MNYLDKFSLDGKRAYVVGGAGLLGTEVSKALASAGANTVVLDNNSQKGEQLVENLLDNNGSADFRHFNCSDIDRFETFFSSLIVEYGNVDILVNCSYPRTDSWGQASFSNISLKTLRDNVDIHMNTYAWFAKLAADQMVKQNTGGSIIQFGSTYGLVSPDLTVYEGTDMKENMAYAAIKGGIINLTRSMAAYYGKWNVRVNNICPGGISGHVAGKSAKQNPVFVNNYSKKTPLKRLGRAEEVASATLFLASEAASYMTGASLIVDGGWTIV